jgi:uncharacterized membrane-anchored protein
VLAAGIAILLAVNWGIYQREHLVSGGRVVLLELAPVDPRSLMQGDYMALRFRVAADVQRAHNICDLRDGHLVVALDERGVGSFRRLDEATPLAADEVRLRYRVRAGQLKFATNAFFFEEGTASRYQQARYGEFRVGSNGDMILTGLRGEKLEALGQPG